MTSPSVLTSTFLLSPPPTATPDASPLSSETPNFVAISFTCSSNSSLPVKTRDCRDAQAPILDPTPLESKYSLVSSELTFSTFPTIRTM